MEEEDLYELKGEGHVGPPPGITEDNHIEKLMDVPETTSNPKLLHHNQPQPDS
jgi:hypothetical protein